jgi:hypothetical protein
MILGMIAVISGLAEIDRVASIYLCVGKLAAHNLGCSPFLPMRASLVGWTVIVAAGNTRVELVAHLVSTRTLATLMHRFSACNF